MTDVQELEAVKSIIMDHYHEGHAKNDYSYYHHLCALKDLILFCIEPSWDPLKANLSPFHLRLDFSNESLLQLFLY